MLSMIFSKRSNIKVKRSVPETKYNTQYSLITSYKYCCGNPDVKTICSSALYTKSLVHNDNTNTIYVTRMIIG